VLFLDLDRFKHVNDSMGHAAGDRTLRAAGARLRESMRDRHGRALSAADEFTVVLEDLAGIQQPSRAARRSVHGVRRAVCTWIPARKS
jgi:diguanylate cyclase (GGDEF)-like protein